MGLNVYAGTVTRYYMHNWKSVLQQYAEARGVERELLCHNDAATVELTRNTAIYWRDCVISGLKLSTAPQWVEDFDTTPYYTDMPDWDAYNALLLYIAAKYCKKEVPEQVERDFDVYEHPILKEFLENRGKHPVTLLDATGWWLPINENYLFQYVMPNSDKAVLASSAMLLAELRLYNSFEWKADRETIITWSSCEGYPSSGVRVENGMLIPIEQSEYYNTVSLAKFCFSILWQAAEFSLKHGVVMILDC